MDDNHDMEHSTPALDHITAALALVDLAGELHDLALNAKDYKARLKKLAALEKKIAAAEQKLSRLQTEAAGIVEAAQTHAAAIHDAAQQRLEAAATAEQELVEREQKIARLEAAWRFIGEPADVMSGFRSPEFSPLQKARMAHGQRPARILITCCSPSRTRRRRCRSICCRTPATTHTPIARARRSLAISPATFRITTSGGARNDLRAAA